MKNKIACRIIALSMAGFLAFSNMSFTVLAEEAENTKSETTEETTEEETTDESNVSYNLRISDASTLLSFADNCKKGGYSQGMSVILDADIDLSGNEDFTGIDSFSGYFNGNNHTVSGLNINSTSGSIGFFGFVEAGAKIENLTVDGVIYSTDKNNYVGLIAGANAGEIVGCNAKGIVTATGTAGGIVGLNGSSGTLKSCKNRASVYSLTGVGGISGENRGTIQSCGNYGGINADSSWLSLEDSSVTTLSLDSIIDSFNETVEVGSDIGGISGLSLGTITKCKNSGVVGYQHAGKNVGGIAGRFCGIIQGCTNSGKVYGKQDVGGIAGQFEPKLMDDGSDLFQYIYELEDLNQQLTNDASAATHAGEDSLNTAADRVTETGEKATNRIDETTGKVTDSITEKANDTKFRVNKATESIKNLQSEIKKTEQTGEQEIKDSNLSGRINTGNITGINVPSYDEVMNSINSVADSIDNAQTAISNYHVADVTGQIDDYIDESATDTYNNVKDIGNDLDEDINDTTSRTSEDLRNLSNKIADQRNILTNDINAINNKISDITSLADEQVDNLKRIADGGDIFEDYSAVDSENEEASRINNCSNEGYVNGDRNVGGIAGAIAIEGTDANDTTKDDSAAKQYITLAVLENSTSNGIIELRKENAGGVVGNSNLGLIRNCVSRNRIVSEEGNYIGGVAGYAKGTITDCSSLSVLEGSNYVGGIAGAATKLRNCYAIVDISDESKWAGEIIGDVVFESEDDITVSHSNMMNYIFNNYYVGEEFGGINNVSYNGIAEEISYDTLISINPLGDFSELKAYFFDSDYNLVASNPIKYGADVSKINFPDLSTDKDTYLVWDGLFTDTVQGNMFLIAGDADDVTVIASSLEKDGRPVALAQGVYYENSTLEVDETKEYDAPEDVSSYSDVNIYSIKLVNTAADEKMKSQIRFYIGDAKNAKVYQYVDKKWILKKDSEIAGSYVQSSFNGDNAVFAVETYNMESTLLVTVGIIFLVIIAAICILLIKSNKTKRKSEI